LAIFVHGCFWHRHGRCRPLKLPSSNRLYWKRKFERNQQRDRENVIELRNIGWRTITIWECETKTPDGIARTRSRLLRALSSSKTRGNEPQH
jgi:DNA mismatch endonuclease (patch repair protein)